MHINCCKKITADGSLFDSTTFNTKRASIRCSWCKSESYLFAIKSWNFWNPGFYLNDWGYRQPARVYVYDDGKRDTIKGKKPVISFGIQTTGGNQIGGFFTMGTKAYFIAEYNSTFERDN